MVPEKKLSEEEIQQKYTQFKAIQEQIEQISQQTEWLNQQNAELDISKRALEELEKTKTQTEILAPIANGVFIRTTLQDNEKLIVNIGANTTVEKTVPEVIKIMEEQKRQATLNLIEAEAVMQELQQQAMKIYQEVEKENV